MAERGTYDFSLRGLASKLAERGMKVNSMQVWRFAHSKVLGFKIGGSPMEQRRLKITDSVSNRRSTKDGRFLVDVMS